MMLQKIWIWLLAVVLIGSAGSVVYLRSRERANKGVSIPANVLETKMTSKNDEPEHVTVQHILISFKGKLPKQIERSQEEAAKLAEKVFALSQQPKANFDGLVTEFTDDQAPGIYAMSNRGVPPQNGEFPREQMVPAFGNIGFKLSVGEIGLAAYSTDESPFGWHIIKRLK